MGAWLAQQTALTGQGHLVSAGLHRDGVGIAPPRVPAKTNEITRVTPRLADCDLAVVTGDALFTQTAIATPLVEEHTAPLRAQGSARPCGGSAGRRAPRAPRPPPATLDRSAESAPTTVSSPCPCPPRPAPCFPGLLVAMPMALLTPEPRPNPTK